MVEGRQKIRVRLADIRYTQDSIASHFKDGSYNFDDTVAALRNGSLCMGDPNDGDAVFPRITVVRLGPYCFSINNRRLSCLKKAFLEQPEPGKSKPKGKGKGRQKGPHNDLEVEVWEQELNSKVLKDLSWRFTAGLFVTQRGGGARSRDSSASEFLVRQLTDEQREAIRDNVRKEYEDKLQQLKKEKECALQLLEKQQEQHTDPEVAERIVDSLCRRGALDLQGICKEFDGQPSAPQLDRVFKSLVDEGRIVIARGAGKPRAEIIYAIPRSPMAHPRLTVTRSDELWCVVSSAAVRLNAALDGRSLAEQSCYVGCMLSLGCAGVGAKAVVRLQGHWAKNDKLLIGVWPEDTDVSQYYMLPGPDSRETDSIKRAPGYWVGCTHGYLHHDIHRFSPSGWTPPKKSDGVQWGVQISNSGSLQFACADRGEELTWRDQQWAGQPAFPADATGLSLALMLQPHNRSDASRAEVVIQEAGRTTLQVSGMTSLDGSA